MQRKKFKKRSKYTCELYITNWYYSKKLGTVFAMYQRMRLNGTSWAGQFKCTDVEQKLSDEIKRKVARDT